MRARVETKQCRCRWKNEILYRRRAIAIYVWSFVVRYSASPLISNPNIYYGINRFSFGVVLLYIDDVHVQADVSCVSEAVAIPVTVKTSAED